MRKPAYMLIGVCTSIVFSCLQLGAQRVTPPLLYYADAYADHYGVPRVLVHSIISQESNWNPEATSAKGAAGIMQLMPGTALKYGVRNPYSLFENLSGGVQYLADLLKEFHGDMRLAVAAYYCGARRLEESGLSYRNQDAITYVESVRRRYRRELYQLKRQSSAWLTGGQ
jgi:soluble lytic murein transglycosylase-like protein